MILAIVVDAFEKARESLDELQEDRNLLIDIFDTVWYGVLSLFHRWPSRERILKESIEQGAEDVIVLADLLSGGYGFTNEKSATAWYRWQCHNHSMCLIDDEPERKMDE